MSPGHVVSDFTQSSGPGKALILAEGERAEGIDFSIVRGGVVTGKVTQADARPVIEERIYLVSAEQNNQSGRRFTVVSTSQTDDRGIYRMFGLRAGRYKVCAGAPEDTFVPNQSRPSFQRVFSPGVAEFEEARIVEVGEGSETTHVDITVGQTTNGFAVSGVVVDGESHQPISTLRLGLQKIAEGNYAPFLGTTVVSNERGAFRMENVMPGKYSVFVLAAPNSDIRVDAVRFEVVDQPVTGLTLKTARGASITGVVVIEGTQNNQLYDRLAGMRLYSYVRREPGPNSMAASKTTNIGRDGSFHLGGLLPGAVVFNLGAQPGSLPEFLISRVEREGVVQSRSGMEIKDTEQINGVRIVVVHGNGTIQGSIKWDNELPPAGSRLMVRLTRPDDSSLQIRPEEVDARGRFLFRGVPPGSYEMILISTVRTSSSGPLSRQTITVTDGAVTEVVLVVDTGANKTPTP